MIIENEEIYESLKKDLRGELDKRFNEIDKRFERLEEKVDKIDEKLHKFATFIDDGIKELNR